MAEHNDFQGHSVKTGATQLNELKLNFIGKLMFAGIGAWLVGKATNMKIRGTKEEIDAIVNAMVSSKRFQEELKRPGATVESVVQKLGLKNLDARHFESVLGIPWPL